jgi:hypothetical protein
MRAAARRAATDVFSAEVQCTRLVDLLERQAGELNTELVLARSR